MRMMVHKTDPILALVLTEKEWTTNQFRCVEWIQTAQDPRFVVDQGLVSVSAGRHPLGLVMLLGFPNRDDIKPWVGSRLSYTQEEVIAMYQSCGKDPSQIQLGQGGQEFGNGSFHFMIG
jgi:hypothetical protein